MTPDFDAPLDDLADYQRRSESQGSCA